MTGLFTEEGSICTVDRNQIAVSVFQGISEHHLEVMRRQVMREHDSRPVAFYGANRSLKLMNTQRPADRSDKE
ncbi:hypothetical protein J6590_059309 [Homalodisca vitripennis]|nr:hypothetical protein J6590_059309 [Homalodisca vitripennis]